MAELPQTIALPTLISDEEAAAGPPVPRPSGGREVLPPHIELQAMAGLGGMGEVWRAFDHSRGAPVAVKLPRGGALTESLALRSEFRRAQAIHHPNLVALYELFVGSAGAAFTMEWIDGAPLSVSQDAAPLRRHLRAVLDGLEALHQAGLVHGDVKQSNVMVADANGETNNQRVILLDFGLMRQTGSTTAGYAGTLEFMAPELLLRQGCTPATDLYALGVLLYLALTGRPPVSGDAERQRMHKMGQWFEAPVSIRPDCPPELSALCMALLSPEPDERPSLESARAALRGADEPETGSLRAPSRRWVPRPVLEWGLIEAARPDPYKAKLVGVFGGSGMGKTALLDRAARRGGVAQQLRGACSVVERVALPGLDALVDQLADLLRSRAHRGRPSPSRLVDAAGLLFPVLIGGAPRATAPNAEERAAAMDALAALLNGLAAQSPLLLVLEDLQWAGPDTSALLARLLPRLGPGCVVLLSADAEPALRAVCGGAALSPFAVGPLSAAELQGAVGAWGPAALGALPLGEGLPPYAIALAAALQPQAASPGSGDRGGDPWSGLRALAARLGGEGERVVQLCAVSEGPLPLRLLPLLRASETGARAAIYAGLLRVQASAEGPQLRLAIGPARAYLQPDPAVAAELHGLLGDVFDRDGDAAAATAAGHLRLAGQLERARAAHRRAGRWALRGGAPAQAVVQLRAALELGAPLAELGEDYGQALSCDGDIERAAKVWLETAEALGGADRIKLRGWAGGLLLGTGQLSEGVAVYDALMADLGMKALPGNLGAVASMLITRGLPSQPPGAAPPTAEEAASLEAMWALGLGLARLDPLPGLAALGRHRARAFAVASPKHQLLSLSAALWGGPMLRLSAEEVEQRMAPLMPLVHDREAIGTVLGARLLRAVTEGDWVQAAVHGEAAAQHFGPELLRSWVGRVVAVDQLVTCMWQVDQAKLRRRAQAVVEACRLAGDHNQALIAELAINVRCTLLAEGVAAGEAQLSRAVQTFGRALSAEARWRRRATSAELRLRAGDPDGVQALFSDLPWAERPFTQFPIPRAHQRWLLGNAELLRPRSPARDRRLQAAIDDLGAIPNACSRGYWHRLRALQRAERGELSAAAEDDAAAGEILDGQGHKLVALLIRQGPSAWAQTGLPMSPGVVDFIIGRDPRGRAG